MNLLDIMLVLVVLSFGWTGYRRGFITGVLSVAGLIGGGALGMVLGPKLIASWFPHASNGRLYAIGAVVIMASVGQALAVVVGSRLRELVTFGPLQIVDSVLGAVASVLAVLVLTWFVATALRAAPSTEMRKMIGTSRVLTTVDRYMPDSARGLFTAFRGLLGGANLPVFGALRAETIAPAGPPDASLTKNKAVLAALTRVVKIEGDAPSCGRRLEGSGFVISPQHVVTNAHVVAGTRGLTVQVEGKGPTLAATVVLYDPQRDVAVLYVPDLKAAPLVLGSSAQHDESGVVAGFPLDGPMKLSPARVREVIEARGPNIYGTYQVQRQVISLYVRVDHGNSGGPLLSADGRVFGLIFAKSLDDVNTGYALTLVEIAPDLDKGSAATAAVGSGRCALG